jgi:serine/threonine-protein kinase ATR
VIKELPQQTLWLFASVVKSRNAIRESRGRAILDRLKVSAFVSNFCAHRCSSEKSSCISESTHVPGLINASVAMVNGLLALCDFPPPDIPRNAGPDARVTLSMKRDIPQLARLIPSPLIVPLQESLTATLPPTSSTVNSHHQPFPQNLPTFHSKSLSLELPIHRIMTKCRRFL